MRMMSTAGSIKNLSALITRSPLEFLTTISASSATRAVAVSDGETATQRFAPKIACSRLSASVAPA